MNTIILPWKVSHVCIYAHTNVHFTFYVHYVPALKLVKIYFPYRVATSSLNSIMPLVCLFASSCNFFDRTHLLHFVKEKEESCSSLDNHGALNLLLHNSSMFISNGVRFASMEMPTKDQFNTVVSSLKESLRIIHMKIMTKMIEILCHMDT